MIDAREPFAGRRMIKAVALLLALWQASPLSALSDNTQPTVRSSFLRSTFKFELLFWSLGNM